MMLCWKHMNSIVTELQSVQLLLIWNHHIFVLVTLGIHFKSLLYEDTSFMCIQVHFQLPAFVFLSKHSNKITKVTWRNYMCTLVISLTPTILIHISALFTISTIQSILIIVKHYFFFKRTLKCEDLIFLAECAELWYKLWRNYCDGITFWIWNIIHTEPHPSTCNIWFKIVGRTW